MGIDRFEWPGPRGWIGISIVGLSVMLLTMMYVNPVFRQDEFIQTIATLVIGTGFGAMAQWAYGSTKTGGELAERNAGIAEQAANATNGVPQAVTIEQPTDKPVPVEES